MSNNNDNDWEKGALILTIVFIWASWVTTIVFQEYYPFTFLLITPVLFFFILLFILWIYATFLIAVAIIWKGIWTGYYNIFAKRFQYERRKSAIIIIILHGTRIVWSIISLLAVLTFGVNPIIFIIFLIGVEGIDTGFDSVFYANFEKKYRDKFYNLDDYTDWATRMIFYFPFYLQPQNLWILGFFLLHLLTSSITLLKYELRWTKIFSPDLNFALFFYFFFPPFFPAVFFGSFGFYLTIYIYYVFPRHFMPEGEPRSPQIQFLESFEDAIKKS